MSEILFRCWVVLVLGAVVLSAAELLQGRYLGLELLCLALAFWVNEDFKKFKKREFMAKKAFSKTLAGQYDAQLERILGGR